MTNHDAVVIGSGPNGLVAANVLADHGWRVLVLERNEFPGGAVRTADVTAPGFHNDLFSSFYPLAAASPVMDALQLEEHGLRWTHAPSVLAHPRIDGPAVVLHRDAQRTAAGLDADAPGDGAAYLRLVDEWCGISRPFMRSLMTPFPPVRGAAGLVRAAGVDGMRTLARRAVLPLRRFVHEEFDGELASLLFAGSALHADLTPEMAGSALFGWLLVCLAQEHGFPVPIGGAGALTDALITRLRARGGDVRCGTEVAQVEVRDGAAVAVRTSAGDEITALRAVVADCDATRLYLTMVGSEHLPADLLRGIRRIEHSAATFKVDWALSRPIPWSDPAVVGAGTVHVAADVAELSATAAEIALGRVPSRPFLLLGQMTTADATRSPAGTEAAWAYTHVPQRCTGDAGDDGLTGEWTPAEVARFTDRIERRVEALAPGFCSSIIARHVVSPRDMERQNPNLVGGDINGGTAQLHQQLVFRPTNAWGRAETPIRRLYLGSASAHPGGGVHGACGANAARAAIAHDRLRRWTRRA